MGLRTWIVQEPLEQVDADVRNILKAILHMPLSEFKKCGLLVRVICGHLNGEDVYISSSEKEAAIGRAEGLITYTADELIELCKGKPDPDDLKVIHEAKKNLQGILIDTRDRA